jgi:phage terminase small subunit
MRKKSETRCVLDFLGVCEQSAICVIIFAFDNDLRGWEMPVLKNSRHERFAQLLAGGKDMTSAYEAAGYKRDCGNASNLARRDEITSRVQEITIEARAREQKIAERSAEYAAVTKGELLKMARDIYLQAKENGHTAAAVAAIKEIGVLSGVRIERSERGQPGEFEWVEKLSVEELHALAAGELDIESYRKGSVAVN